MSAAGEVEAPRGSRFSAFIYDYVLAIGERAGMRDRRRRVLADARGDTLELGAGTGLNLELYPPSVERLVLTEPEPNMARQLRKRAERSGRDLEVVEAPAEALPFGDASFDTVTGTLFLCTVGDPGGALAEVRRVLRPDGSFLFLEHVRSDEEGLARWQDRLHGPWRAFADGCNCNRRTLELIQSAGFEPTGVQHERWRRMPSIVRPLVSGRATPA